MKVTNLTVGPDFKANHKMAALLICDDNGTPLIGVEEHRGTLIVVYGQDSPEELEEFARRNGISVNAPKVLKKDI